MAAIIQLDIPNANASVSVNDTIYYLSNSSQIKNFNVGDYEDIVRLGYCTVVSDTYIRVNCVKPDGSDNNVDPPASGDFILFSKDNAVNTSSLKGYYAEVKVKNNSTEKAELFRISMNAELSSK